jgi:hypothetical protein
MKKRVLSKICWICLGILIILVALAVSIVSAFYVDFDRIIYCILWYISDLIILYVAALLSIFSFVNSKAFN